MGITFAPDRIVLPALREDIALQPAPPGRDGAPYWNLYDPVRNSFFRIGWMEFELLSRWQAGARPDELSAAVCAETPLSVEEEDVLALLQFLQNNELLRAGHVPILIEASQRVGGRLYTLREAFSAGLYGEAGSMRIPEAHSTTLFYARQRFGLKTRPFPTVQEHAGAGSQPALQKIHQFPPATALPVFRTGDLIGPLTSGPLSAMLFFLYYPR